MKKIIYLLPITVLISACNLNETPKCGDSNVVNKAIVILNEQIKSQVKNEYVEKNFNEYDAIEFANNKGWNSTDYVKTEKKRIDSEADKYADSVLATTILKNIRSNSIKKDIKLCNCSAEASNLNLKTIDVDYTAQQTEDNDKSIYVELTYTIKP
jgi:hypothetical protein